MTQKRVSDAAGRRDYRSLLANGPLIDGPMPNSLTGLIYFRMIAVTSGERV